MILFGLSFGSLFMSLNYDESFSEDLRGAPRPGGWEGTGHFVCEYGYSFRGTSAS